MSDARHTKGFTFIELTIALLVVATIAAASAPNIIQKVRKVQTDKTANEVWTIAESAQNFISDTGNWPDETNNCADAITVMNTTPGYLQNFDSESPWYDAATNPGGEYTTSCTSTNFTIEVDTHPDEAPLIANTLAQTTVAGRTTTTTIPTPGKIPALDAVLPRDGSRPMTGDLDMNGNNIDNAATTTTDDLDVNNDASVGNNLDVTNNVTAGGDVTSQQDIVGNRFVDRNDPNFGLDPNQTSRVRNLDGRQIRNEIKNRTLSEAVQDATVVPHGANVPKPNCPAGQTPQIFTSVAAASCNNSGKPPAAIQTWATNAGANWQVVLRVRCETGWINPSPAYGRVTAMSKCTN